MNPTNNEIDELLKFIPLLRAPGFSPIKQWKGGRQPDGGFQPGYPEYDEITVEFYAIVAECFTCQYDPARTGAMVENPSEISEANLDQIMQMLTFCVRGERFCDGHWAIDDRRRIHAAFVRAVGTIERSENVKNEFLSFTAHPRICR